MTDEELETIADALERANEDLRQMIEAMKGELIKDE